MCVRVCDPISQALNVMTTDNDDIVILCLSFMGVFSFSPCLIMDMVLEYAYNVSIYTEEFVIFIFRKLYVTVCSFRNISGKMREGGMSCYLTVWVFTERKKVNSFYSETKNCWNELIFDGYYPDGKSEGEKIDTKRSGKKQS